MNYSCKCKNCNKEWKTNDSHEILECKNCYSELVICTYERNRV